MFQKYVLAHGHCLLLSSKLIFTQNLLAITHSAVWEMADNTGLWTQPWTGSPESWLQCLPRPPKPQSSSSRWDDSVQFSRSVVSDSLRPHESQHARSPCPSPTPGVHSDSCPSSQWCHPAISSSVIPFSSCPESLPAWVFSNKSALHMRWPKYWSFSLSINPSKEYPGLISFRMDWLGLPIFYTSILPEPLGHWVFIQTCLSHSKILVQR